MKFEDSPISKTLNFYKLEMPFGNFFFCEKFVIAEINAGVHYDWTKIEPVLKEVTSFYSPGVKLGYISNRIHSYSVDPQDWSNVAKASNIMAGSAIVYYNYVTYLNASLEKHFSKADMRHYLSLEEAINWILSLEALN